LSSDIVSASNVNEGFSRSFDGGSDDEMREFRAGKGLEINTQTTQKDDGKRREADCCFTID
jgi:hypothetical protein